MQWFIGQPLADGLNLCHVLLSPDGTNSPPPQSFTGSIGTQCASDVWKTEVVAFYALPGFVKEETADAAHHLSHD